MTAPSIVARPPPLDLCVDCRRTDEAPSYQAVKVQTSEGSPLQQVLRRKPTTRIDAVVQVESNSAPKPVARDATIAKPVVSREDTELHRRLQPKSDADFGLLQTELQKWRDREQGHILASHPAVQIDLEQEALAKEGFLLRKIDSLRAKEHRDRRERRIDGELAEMARPHCWTLANGDQIQVVTPATSQASNLRRIYNGLAEKVGDSRKAHLLEARGAVTESLRKDSVSTDLIELIDRHLDLLNRGMDERVLQSLNNRVRSLLLQFIQEINTQET